jgi:hypothetical protein
MNGSSLRCFALLMAGLCTLASSARAEDYKLEKPAAVPAGLSPEVAQALAKEGYRVAGPQGPMIDLWPAKEIVAKKDFKPTLNVKYPFQPGQFIGVLQVNKGTAFSDFRKQAIAPGVYTVRYGQQPQDGNHVGTSDFSDFLLALPAGEDKAPKGVDNVKDLQARSAVAAGTSHPAILQLLPSEEKATEAKLVHDADREFWTLEFAGGKPPVPFKLVVVGAGAE